MEWLRRQGPWSPALIEIPQAPPPAVRRAGLSSRILYAPTVLGMRIAPGKSILVPTAHDEPAIHLEIYKELFSLPAAVAYNTEVERRFLSTHFSVRARRGGDRGLRCRPAAGAPGRWARRRGDQGPLDEPDLADAKDDDQPLPPHIRGPRRDVPAASPPARTSSGSTAAASIRARAARN